MGYTPMGTVPPSLQHIFNRPINADNEHYEDLKTHQDKYIKANDTPRD